MFTQHFEYKFVYTAWHFYICWSVTTKRQSITIVLKLISIYFINDRIVSSLNWSREKQIIRSSLTFLFTMIVFPILLQRVLLCGNKLYGCIYSCFNSYRNMKIDTTNNKNNGIYYRKIKNDINVIYMDRSNIPRRMTLCFYVNIIPFWVYEILQKHDKMNIQKVKKSEKNEKFKKLWHFPNI